MNFWKSVGDWFKPKKKLTLISRYKFTNSESFRFFVEALRELHAYQRQDSKATWETVNAKFLLATNSYPDDFLPKFYYACTLSQREENREKSLRIFAEIQTADPSGEMGDYARRNFDALKDWKYPAVVKEMVC